MFITRIQIASHKRCLKKGRGIRDVSHYQKTFRKKSKAVSMTKREKPLEKMKLCPFIISEISRRYPDTWPKGYRYVVLSFGSSRRRQTEGSYLTNNKNIQKGQLRLLQSMSSYRLACRVGDSIISRNRYNRYEKIDHGLIVREQGIKKGK